MIKPIAKQYFVSPECQINLQIALTSILQRHKVLCLYKKTMFLLELTYIGSRYPINLL